MYVVERTSEGYMGCEYNGAIGWVINSYIEEVLTTIYSVISITYTNKILDWSGNSTNTQACSKTNHTTTTWGAPPTAGVS